MPFFSTTVAFGMLLATGGLLVGGSLVLFMFVLRDDGPKIGGDREPAPLGWPISKDAAAPNPSEKPGQSEAPGDAVSR